MTTVGQIEKKTQARVVALFRERLGYDYLGDRIDLDNRNIELTLLRDWLTKQGVSDTLINRALHELNKVATDTSKHLYDRNKEVYDLLRYGVKVQPGAGENHVTVWLIDWKHPENNHFAIAEEVTVKGADAKASTKRPDVVIYINGIALGVLELKRSTVSVAEGIRQNLDNQKKEFIQPFFSTLQWVMAGNDTEGLRYATIETPEKYYLTLGGGKRPLRGRAEPAGSPPVAGVRQGAAAGADPRLRGVRRRHQEAVPPEPVFRRQGRAGLHPPPRGRHHLAHPGQRQVADHGLAGQMDTREPRQVRGC